MFFFFSQVLVLESTWGSSFNGSFFYLCSDSRKKQVWKKDPRVFAPGKSLIESLRKFSFSMKRIVQFENNQSLNWFSFSITFHTLFRFKSFSPFSLFLSRSDLLSGFPDKGFHFPSSRETLMKLIERKSDYKWGFILNCENHPQIKTFLWQSQSCGKEKIFSFERINWIISTGMEWRLIDRFCDSSL